MCPILQNNIEEKQKTTLWFWNSNNGNYHISNSSKDYISTSVCFLFLTFRGKLEKYKTKQKLQPYAKPGNCSNYFKNSLVLFQPPVQRIKSIMCNSMKRSCSNLRYLRPENLSPVANLEGSGCLLKSNP